MAVPPEQESDYGTESMPVLASAQSVIDMAVKAGAEVIRIVDGLAESVIEARIPLPSWADIEGLEAQVPRIESALRSRFGYDSVSGSVTVNMTATAEDKSKETFAMWSLGAERLESRVQKSWVPVFDSEKRRSKAQDMLSHLRNLVERLGELRLRRINECYLTFLTSMPHTAAQLVAGQAASLAAASAQIPPLPCGIAGWRPGQKVVAGPGRLRVQIGSVAPGPALMNTRKPAIVAYRQSRTDEPAEFAMPQISVPVFVDLDRDGGLITDSISTVASVALRFLGTLPPSRLKIAVFDPERLGDSATFLYQLGEATEQVIGDKVRTTERELTDLLLELEQHITLVTQKYLQGQHPTLTSYNEAAGEVAEPYRFLVLFDYPAGFRRSDGRFDDEALTRLSKIIESGPRCGVFVFVVSNELANVAAVRPVPPDPRAPAATSVREGAAVRLPQLFTNRMVDAATLARLCELPEIVEIHRKRNESELSYVHDQVRLARAGANPFVAWSAGKYWIFRPDEGLAPEAIADISAQVERSVLSAAEVRVTPRRVAELAHAKMLAQVAKGTREPYVVAYPEKPTTWWQATSADGIAATFGRAGAADVAILGLDSQTSSNVLMGGRPGAGKSVWLHSVIASLCQTYSPGELELYLVDFKEGVEFQVYAAGRLPHARVVAVESERDFGLSVLSALDEEITKRGETFRRSDGTQVSLDTYRRTSGQVLARIVLIIDEFHVLFERDDKVATSAGELLERIVRQGRAFGVHTILASQTLAGTSGLGKHIFDLIPIRVALQSSDADSRLLLADDNADARLLSRPGEGILNTKGGIRDANSRFQTVFCSPEERESMVGELRAMADARGFQRGPVIFQGRAPASLADVEPGIFRSDPAGTFSVPLGMPLALGGPLTARLRREPGGNMLVVANEDAGYSVLSCALVAACASGVAVDILDFGSSDAPWAAVVEQMLANGQVRYVKGRAAADTLKELVDMTGRRRQGDGQVCDARMLLLVAWHRARELEPGSPESDLLEQLLRDGPDVGVHTVAWCDKAISLERRASMYILREFGLRMLGQTNRDDSQRLIDSDLAASLPGAQAVLDDHDEATTVRFRWFEAMNAATAKRMAVQQRHG